jgi:asparagine synthetase B (glutamine-hydrolysing)
LALGMSHFSLLLDLSGGRLPLDAELASLEPGSRIARPGIESFALADTWLAPPRTNSQKDILASYRQDQDHLLDRLEGSFSFALWDGEKQELFAARDALAGKPLYYLIVDGHFICLSSRLRALLPLLKSYRLDEVRAALFVGSPNELSHKRTFLEDIKRVPPGHSLRISPSNGKLIIRRYWTWPAEGSLSIPLASRLVRFRDLMRRSVTERLEGVDRCALLLSAGLDSTAILAEARRCKTELTCFTMHYPRCPEVDETNEVDALLVRHGLRETHKIDMSGVHPTHAPIFAYDHPPIYANETVGQHLFSEIRRLGFRHVVTGIDGDSVLGSGFHRPSAHLREGKIVKALADVVMFGLRNDRPLSSRPLAFARAIKMALRIMRRTVKPSPILSKYGRDVLEDVSFHAAYDHRDALSLPSLATAYEFLDAQTSALQLTAINPFLDRQLATLCVSLPASTKRYAGYSRPLIRSAYEDFRGYALSWHAKHHLGPWVEQNLRIDSKVVMDEIAGTPLECLVRSDRVLKRPLPKLTSWRLFSLARWWRQLPGF